MLLTSPCGLPPVKYLTLNDGETLAYLHHPGKSPGIMFLPGFQSTMKSSKPQAIFDFCQVNGLEYTALDYYGHGESSGSMNDEKGTIKRWISDAIHILDRVPEAPEQILVGSSMGSWLMLLLSKERVDRIKGLVGIASAPDFTSLLTEQINDDTSLSEQMKSSGYCDLPTQYDPKGYYRIHQTFLMQAESHFILSTECKIHVPLRLIHGRQDEDIPYNISQTLFDKVVCNDKKLILVDNGNHRLSKPHELEIIITAIKDIL
mmetsp:Transcript_26745/g.39626  ORF Transcript_26745/g.39626 Transcript_26745/m.39626 type:complete len:261 (-) Transcript_26745:9-791(-)